MQRNAIRKQKPDLTLSLEPVLAHRDGHEVSDVPNVYRAMRINLGRF
jgi:hypothetical protein